MQPDFRSTELINTRLRGLVNKAFSIRQANELRALTQRNADALLDEWIRLWPSGFDAGFRLSADSEGDWFDAGCGWNIAYLSNKKPKPRCFTAIPNG